MCSNRSHPTQDTPLTHTVKTTASGLGDGKHIRTKCPLVYFIKQPLTMRDANRYGIDFFLNRGHKIIVIDFTRLLHPETPEPSAPPNRDNLTICKISRWEELEQSSPIIEKAELAFFLTQSNGISKDHTRPLRLLRKLKIPYVIFSPIPYPGLYFHSKGIRPLSRAKTLLKRLAKINIHNSIVLRLPSRWQGIREADYMILPSHSPLAPNNLVGNNTKIIESHTYDYELYMREKNQVGDNLKQAVFIDQYLPYHRGFLELRATTLDAGIYYSTLRRVFDRIEQEYNLKVVIAAHPKTDFPDHLKGFGDREVFYDQTLQLVRKSKLVLGHYSTAISFAVMFKKPVMLLVTKKLSEVDMYLKYYFQSFSEELGTPLRFVDDPETADLSNPFFIDGQKYASYEGSYIKCPNSPERPHWKIVTDAIPELNSLK